MIYTSEEVVTKLDDYAQYLVMECGYDDIEAKTRRWEIEYQIKRYGSSPFMTPNKKGVIRFKTVLQRQEIARSQGDVSQLIPKIKRRKGRGYNTNWEVKYYVSQEGNVYVTSLNYYNTFSEERERLVHLITEEIMRKIYQEAMIG
jgi:hypothetical protein